MWNNMEGKVIDLGMEVNRFLQFVLIYFHGRAGVSWRLDGDCMYLNVRRESGFTIVPTIGEESAWLIFLADR